MTKFSANLGFLFTELKLPDAIRAAKVAGFDAVECHWPYSVSSHEVKSALTDTGLEMLGLNTLRGDVASGENGLSALPNRVKDARNAIDIAVTYGAEIGVRCIHVMAGFSDEPTAHDVFISNLRYACDAAGPHNIDILIEPLNRYDAPGYFLKTTGQALDCIKEVDKINIKLMFDCYHVQLSEGDLSNRLANLMPIIGHIQFASVPDRTEPDHGELDYHHMFDLIARLGYEEPLGAESKPVGPTGESLNWLKKFD